MPTLSRRSSRSTNTTTTLRSPKPPSWSGSTKSTPAKSKNGASAAVSLVFAEPEMANLGDGIGAVTTLSTSASAGRSMGEDQNTSEGRNNERDSIPGSPTPARKITWYGSLSRSRGRRRAQQLLPVNEPQPEVQSRPNILIQQAVIQPQTDVALSESPTTMLEAQAQHLVVRRPSPEPEKPTPIAQEVEISAPLPTRRGWFSSAINPTQGSTNLTPGILPSTSPRPTAIDLPEITLSPTHPMSPTSFQTLPAASDPPVMKSLDILSKPQEIENIVASTHPARAPIAPTRGWFSSSAIPAAPPAAAPAPPPEDAPFPQSAPPVSTLPSPMAPDLLLPAPPDVAAVLEKIEVSCSPSSDPAQSIQPPPSLPIVKRSWFSSYTSSPTSSVPAPAPTSSTPPRSPNPHSIPSSIDEEVPALSSHPFPPPTPGSGSGISMAPLTPSPSVSGPPVLSPPTPSPALSNSSSTSSKSTTQPEPRQRLSSLSSLNPSTSRFTLIIPLPLLGRAKVPLPVSKKEETNEVVEEAALFQAGKHVPQIIEPITADITATNTATTTNATVMTKLVPISPSLSPSPSTPTFAEQPSTEQSNPVTSSEASTIEDTAGSENNTVIPSTSWWSYVGWSSAPAPSTSTNADAALGTTETNHTSSATGPGRKHVKDEEPTAVATAAMPPTTATTSVPLTSTPLQMKGMTKSEMEMDKKVTDGGNGPTSKDAKDAKIGPSVVAKAMPDSAKPVVYPTPDTNSKAEANANVMSADTVSMKSQGTASQAWYSPWAWYGSGVTANAGDGGEEEEKSGEAKTEAELVKEAALAREETLVPLATPESPREEPKIEEHNPVERSFETHRSGWAAFFSSRALGIKLIKAPGDMERDENGLEVMELDFGEDDAQSTIGGASGASTGSAVLARDVGDAAAPGATAADVGQGKVTDNGRGRTGDRAKKGNIIAPPLTISDSVKKDVEKVTAAKKGSPAASVNNIPAASKPVPKKGSRSSVKDGAQAPTKKGSTSAPTTRSSTPGPGTRTQVPNLVLPTWADTFHTAPRSLVPPPQETTFGKTMKFVSGVLFATEKDKGGSVRSGVTRKGKARVVDEESLHFGKGLPQAWDVVKAAETKGKGKGKGGDVDLDVDVLRGCKRVVVIGIHGWFPGAVMRTVLGEPTGTSAKFVNMMVQALEEFEVAHEVKLEKITKIPLEGEGTISGRVHRLYTNLQANSDWMEDLHSADAIIVATHSQGSIVSTHLLDRLIQDGHIRTRRGANPISATSPTGLRPVDSFSAAGVEALACVGANATSMSGSSAEILDRKPQRICCLALCGIHLGPLRYLSSSSLLLPYIQYFESAAAKELFEFQNTESDVSKEYVKALTRVVDQGTKMVYVASLNDQVVPIYSGLFTAVSHPLILRALYIDGDAYHSSDFLSNLLVLLLRILNSGISDSGLLAHLSEATAGSLNGVGHSTAYEELSTYALAVKYLFLTDDGLDNHPELMLEPFNANSEQNDYEIPWSLRDVIADERVAHFFGREISELRDAFREWHPRTTILRDLKRKLQPIQKLPSSFSATSPSSSKL